MSLYHAVQVAVYLVIMAAAGFGKQERCSSPVPVEVLESAVNSLLSKLPDSTEFTAPYSNLEEMICSYSPVKFGTIKYSGFQNLHRVGLIRTYCKYGKPMIAVDVRTWDIMQMELAFTICGKISGSVGGYTSFSELLLKFYVLDEGQEFPLRIADVVPMSSRDAQAFVYGCGTFMHKIGRWVGRVLAPYYKYPMMDAIAGGLYGVIVDMKKP